MARDYINSGWNYLNTYIKVEDRFRGVDLFRQAMRLSEDPQRQAIILMLKTPYVDMP
jgi:hypothetical protein